MADSIDLYKCDEIIEAAQKDWHMALLIFKEMDWRPPRPLEAYVHPLVLLCHKRKEPQYDRRIN